MRNLIRILIVFCLALTTGKIFTQDGNLKSILAGSTTMYNTYETFTWDGVNTEWANNTVTYYIRNANGSESIKLTNVWDAANGVFANSTKETYTYNASGKITIYLYQTWTMVDGILDWTNDKRTVYAYNAAGALTSTTDYSWKLVNAKLTWANTTRHLYAYNAQNLQSEDRYQTGKQDTLWDDVTKTLYVYDAKKNNTELTLQDWKLTEWVNNYRHMYKYNASNKMTEDVYQTWDLALTTPAWENIKKTAYNYDSKINQNLIYYSNWIKGSIPPVWDTNAKDTLTYNAKGWLYITTHMTGTPALWTNDYRNTDYYDGYGNKTEKVFEIWMGVWNKTTYSSKWILSYDIDRNLTVKVTQIWSGTAYENTMKEVFSDFDSFTPSTEIKNHTSGINVFPNPVSDLVTISVADAKENISVTITDINGSVVIEKANIASPTTVNMSQLASGIYVVTVKSGNDIKIGKIIKE